MSDTPDTTVLDQMRERLHEYECEYAALTARIAEVRACIQMLERGPRRRPGRPRNTALEVVAPPAPAPDDAA